MKAAGLVIRVGAILFGVGLFLLLTPLAMLASLFVLPIGAVMIFGGLSATNIRPSGLALVGGVIALLGFSWTIFWAWILLIPCTVDDCLPSAPLVDQPAIWLGVFMVVLGVAMIVIAAVKHRNARGNRSTHVPLAGNAHD